MWMRIVLAGYWLALAVATHLPRDRVPDEVPKSDKLLHFGAFAILALLFRLNVKRAWLAPLVLIPYATVDEYTQQFVGRYTELGDWIANCAGVVAILAAYELYRRLAR